MLGIVLVVLDGSGIGSWVGNPFVLMAAATLALNFTLCRNASTFDVSPRR
jgi:drug/metabolite transporter (DMT)-like permease